MEPVRVCVADECEESGQFLCDGLRNNSYEAIHARDCKEVLAACGRDPVDLVLLDVALPHSDGYEACLQLKQSPKSQETSVIFVSSKGNLVDYSRGYDLGVADYVTKPYNLPIVMIRVDAAIRARRLRDRLRCEDFSLCDTAFTDHLTGLRNRRFLLERLQEEVEEAHRYTHPVSCVLFDVDDIVAMDDELGPVSLDDLMVEIGMSIRNFSRSFDIVARYDGTVFAAVLPHTPVKDAVDYARKIQEDVDSTTFSDPCFPTCARLSVGLTCYMNNKPRAADFVLGEAMRNLLEAKSRPEQRFIARTV